MYLKGQYNEAIIYTDHLDEKTKTQILSLLNHPLSEGMKIRIMPDVHVGKGAVIGTTLSVHDKIAPNLVGVDIGCGLRVIQLKERVIDFKKLDKVIREYIPSGFSIRKTKHDNASRINLERLKCKEALDLERAYLSIGTLGGGNHFIEINEDEVYNKYLVIHSGSRNIGHQVASHYTKKAQAYALKQGIDVPQDLAYLENQDLKDYLHDMKIMQAFADLNRETMASVILEKMNLRSVDHFSTIHNYIDLDHMILRKGAVSAQKDERFILPLNMADGSIIFRGKGNPDWNYSAPHGAGRVMSRTQAKRNLKLKDFKDKMFGVYSSCISKDTLDEAPQVYKNPQDILKHMDKTAIMEARLKALYNFKAK